jgi:hypothetical protein
MCQDTLLETKSQSELLEATKDKILEVVGSEGRALIQAIPALEQLLGEQSTVPPASLSTANIDCCLYQLQAFLQAIASGWR